MLLKDLVLKFPMYVRWKNTLHNLEGESILVGLKSLEIFSGHSVRSDGYESMGAIFSGNFTESTTEIIDYEYLDIPLEHKLSQMCVEKLCDCEKYSLFRYGCKCGGK